MIQLSGMQIRCKRVSAGTAGFRPVCHHSTTRAVCPPTPGGLLLVAGGNASRAAGGRRIQYVKPWAVWEGLAEKGSTVLDPLLLPKPGDGSLCSSAGRLMQVCLIKKLFGRNGRRNGTDGGVG